jgi:hypothetical protein
VSASRTDLDLTLTSHNSTPQPIVTIIITSPEDSIETQVFNIHQNILCYYSHFFAQKLNNAQPSPDTNPKPITLADAEPGAFGLFVNWIYYQKIRNEHGKLPSLIELARLWVFGERFQIAALQNATMDHIRNEVAYPTDFEPFIHFAYMRTGEGCELRRLAIRRLAWTLPEPFKEIVGRLPALAQLDLIMELKSQRDATPKDFWRQLGPAKEFYVVEREGDGGEGSE